MLEKKYTVIQEEHDDLSDSLEEILESNTLSNGRKKLQFKGQIVVAEDQFINLQILQNYFESLALVQQTNFCIDGQIAIDTAKEIFDSQISQADINLD